MRKASILLLCVLIFVFLTLPVAAADSDVSEQADRPDRTEILSSCFPFDSIMIENGSNEGQMIPYFFNDVPVGQSYSFSGDGYSAYADSAFFNIKNGLGVAHERHVIAGCYYFDDATSVTFSSQFVLYCNSELVFGSWENNLYFKSVQITGNIVDIVDGVESETFLGDKFSKYEGEEKAFSFYADLNDVTEISFPKLFQDIYGETMGQSSFLTTANNFIITDLSITVSFWSDDVYKPAFCVFSRIQDSEFNFYKWVNSMDLYRSSITNQIDFTDPLMDGAESFFEFEFMPGLSLNKIFYYVLIVGLILWFITVLI